MSSKNVTLMVVPDKGDKVKKYTMPTWVIRILTLTSALMILIGLFIFFDYVHLLSQVAENKKLRMENHLIKRDLANVRSKVEALDKSVGRLRSFAQKLRVISELDRPGLPSVLQEEEAPKAGDDLYEEESVIEKRGAENTTPQQNAPSLPGSNQGALADLEARLATDDPVQLTAQLFESADALERASYVEEKNYAFLVEYFQDQVVRLRFTPSIIPAEGRVSSPFGVRFNPFVNLRTFHNGIDIANRHGTPIYATADGTVSVSGVMGALGKTVRIDHGYNVVTKYGHLAEILVKRGQKVKRGDKIATMGNTGRSTGPHLHYQIEIKRRPVNPKLFFLEETF